MLITWIVVKCGSGGMRETGETSQRTRIDGSSLPPRRPTGCRSQRHCHTKWRSFPLYSTWNENQQYYLYL